MLLLGLLPWSSIITYRAVRFRPATSEVEYAVLDLLNARGWQSVVSSAGLLTPRLSSLCVSDPATAQFGLCEATAAAAETGTVLLAHDAGNPRSVSLLPRAVGFLLRASSIVSRLTEILDLLDTWGAGLGSCVTLVSGPSRSADIGSVTCRGAHGPAMVFVWLIENE